jgi:predicted CopG family antitoxin
MRRSPGRCPGEPLASSLSTPRTATIWVAPGVVAKLKALRGPGESYSDVILRIARDDGKNSGSYSIMTSVEYSVYPLHDELRALENIKLYQKKASRTFNLECG